MKVSYFRIKSVTEWVIFCVISVEYIKLKMELNTSTKSRMCYVDC